MHLIEFIITSAILTIMPGPDILFVMAQSMIQGKRAGFMVALGLSSGLFVHTAAAALGISIIIANSPTLFSIIKYAGVAYLLYMGIMALLEVRKSIKADKETTTPQASELQTEINTFTDDIKKENIQSEAGGKNGWKLYRTGITMNLLNPKVILFFLALFPQFIDISGEHAKTDILILGALFALIAVTIFSTVAVISSYLSDTFSIKSLSPKILGVVKCIIYWAIAVMFFIN